MKQILKAIGYGILATVLAWIVGAAVIFRFSNPSATETQTLLAAPHWLLGNFEWCESEAGGKGE